MKALKLVAAAFVILQVWTVRVVWAGPALPSAVKQRIVLHGVSANRCEPIIDGDGAAVLDEAAELLRKASSRKASSMVVVVVEDSQTPPDPMRLQQVAEAASVYLDQHGIDLARIKIETTGGTPIVLCAVREPICSLSGSC